jgi:Transposase DDE domain group 1
MLRPGNVHSAEGWRTVLEPVLARYCDEGFDLYFRGDAAFAKPELYELLEAEDIGYAIRLPANRVLQERVGHLLIRPVGRPPKKPQVFFAASPTGRRAGRGRAGWWPRSSGTRANSTRGSGSSDLLR